MLREVVISRLHHGDVVFFWTAFSYALQKANYGPQEEVMMWRLVYPIIYLATSLIRFSNATGYINTLSENRFYRTMVIVEFHGTVYTFSQSYSNCPCLISMKEEFRL